jgi:hypothetical protein
LGTDQKESLATEELEKGSGKTAQKTTPKSEDPPTTSQDQLLAALKNGQSQLKKAPQVRGEATNAKRLLFMSEVRSTLPCLVPERWLTLGRKKRRDPIEATS